MALVLSVCLLLRASLYGDEIVSRHGDDIESYRVRTGTLEIARPEVYIFPAAPQSDPRLRPPLIGTGRTGPQNPVPPYVQKVAARVGAEMAGLKTNDQAIPVKFAKLWKTAWPFSFNVPLRVGKTADIATGRVLPGEVADYRSQREVFTSQLQRGELGIITNSDELEAAYMMFGLAVGDAQSGGGNLIRAIADRVNQLPPTKGDVVLFNIVSQALRDLRRGGSNATIFADLLPLAEVLQGFEWVETGRKSSPPRWKRMAMR